MQPKPFDEVDVMTIQLRGFSVVWTDGVEFGFAHL
jgi:hypothetical protein